MTKLKYLLLALIVTGKCEGQTKNTIVDTVIETEYYKQGNLRDTCNHYTVYYADTIPVSYVTVINKINNVYDYQQFYEDTIKAIIHLYNRTSTWCKRDGTYSMQNYNPSWRLVFKNGKVSKRQYYVQSYRDDKGNFGIFEIKYTNQEPLK